MIALRRRAWRRARPRPSTGEGGLDSPQDLGTTTTETHGADEADHRAEIAVRWNTRARRRETRKTPRSWSLGDHDAAGVGVAEEPAQESLAPSPSRSLGMRDLRQQVLDDPWHARPPARMPLPSRGCRGRRSDPRVGRRVPARRGGTPSREERLEARNGQQVVEHGTPRPKRAHTPRWRCRHCHRKGAHDATQRARVVSPGVRGWRAEG